MCGNAASSGAPQCPDGTPPQPPGCQDQQQPQANQHGAHGAQNHATPACICADGTAMPNAEPCADGSQCSIEGPGSAGGGQPPAEGQQMVAVTLDCSIDDVGEGEQRTSFLQGFRQSVATLMGIQSTRIRVDSVTGGSVVVQFEVRAANPGQPGQPSVADAVQALETAFAEGATPVIGGVSALSLELIDLAGSGGPTLGCPTATAALQPLLEVYTDYTAASPAFSRAESSGGSERPIIAMTCIGCLCPDGKPPLLPPDCVPNCSPDDPDCVLIPCTCSDGSEPDISVTDCCASEESDCAGKPMCSSCCEDCRHGYLNRQLDPWPVLMDATPLSLAGPNPTCQFGEPDFCPALGVVLECQPDITLDNWVVPGQAGYELCIANGFSSTSRQASLFGQDLFFAKHCPRSVRSAFSVDNPDRNGFSIEQACAGSDPDWITTMTECSTECALAFMNMMARCSSDTFAMEFMGGQRESFWRVDATGSIVTVTAEALQNMMDLCAPSGACPPGTAPEGTPSGESMCVPTSPVVDSEGRPLSCPIGCGPGNIKENGHCRPCPRGTHVCGSACTPCSAGFDSHAGSELCSSCPHGSARCLGAGQCAAHTSPSAFCASCEFGRFPVRDKCLECPSFTWLPVIVTLSLCVLIPLVICKIVTLSRLFCCLSR